MTPPARRDRRSDYRNFPSAYGELFMLCRDGERHVLGPFDTEKAARAAARDLYRYRGFLRTAVETDHSDVFARQVHDVARDLKIEVVAELPGGGMFDANTIDYIERGAVQHAANYAWHIALALNPIVAAVARLTTTAGKARSATVSVPPSLDRAKHGVASVPSQPRQCPHVPTYPNCTCDPAGLTCVMLQSTANPAGFTPSRHSQDARDHDG